MDAIFEHYDALLLKDPSKTADEISFLEREMDRQDCRFGEKIFPTFLKPMFLSAEQIREISGIIHHAMNILEKVTHLYFSNPQLREYFYINDRAHELIEIDQGYAKNIVIARPDSFLVGQAIRFIEFNCDSPAGMGYCDIEEDLYHETFVLKEMKKRYDLESKKRSLALLDALISTYKEFAGQHKTPNIAIVDWREVRTQNEFRILERIFKSQGYDTVIADPRDLRFLNGRLEHKGFPIDLIYRRVIFRELIEKYDEVKDLFEAYRRGKVCVVNPLRSRLASNKAILAIVTNQRKFKNFFNEEENRVIQKNIPWTRRMIDMQTSFGDNLVFLRRYVISHRDQLVLKPADSYGGKNVVIGLETAQNDWEQLVNRILSNNEDWVVQRFVEISEIAMPVLEDGSVVMKTKKYNLNPFIFSGEYAGCMARFSDQRVINVTAGGGMVPVISYKEKG